MKLQRTARGTLAALAAASLLLAGCSKHGSDSTPSNGPGSVGANSAGQSAADSGGDMTCKAFLAQDKDGKSNTIEQFLASRGESTSKSNIAATRISAEMFCRTTGKDKLVKNVETG